MDDVLSSSRNLVEELHLGSFEKMRIREDVDITAFSRSGILKFSEREGAVRLVWPLRSPSPRSNLLCTAGESGYAPARLFVVLSPVRDPEPEIPGLGKRHNP